jgi:predicted peptidase
MRALCLFLIMSIASLYSLRAKDRPQDKLLTAQRFEQTITKDISSDYLQFLPRDYDAKPAERWPLLLFLHGAGERGTNVWQADYHGPSKYILDHPDFPFVMISPLCGSNEVWSNEKLLALLEHAQQTLRVDEHRIYLTGISMGGFGTWSLALERPEKFAAVIPICGGADTLAIILARLGYATPEKLAALKTLPIWAFHGGKDPAVPVGESERAVEALKQCGVAAVKLTIYPEAMHDCWTQTYSNPEIYAWLLQHHR